jgi:hypothetical protein
MKQVQEFKECCFFKKGQPLRTRNCRSGLLTDLATAPNMAEVKEETNVHGKKRQNLYCSSIVLVKQEAYMAEQRR